jgi:putative NIF3 family GTP cyclohydrolase 1 type 2
VIERCGFLTGSGYGAVREAAELGCQALVTGDIRESTMAEARELGLSVIAAGHEATERLGVRALAEELAARFEVTTTFLDDPNPV